MKKVTPPPLLVYDNFKESKNLMKIIQTYLQVSILLLLSLSLISCGSDDSASSTPTNINGDLSGKIFIGSGFDGPWILDLTTGHYTPIPGVDWDDPDTFPGLARFSAHPARDGSEFVQTVENCEDTGTLSYDDCFIFHDQQGNISHQFSIAHGAYGTDGPAKLSFNRQFMAVPVATTLPSGYLRLYSREGQFFGESNEIVQRSSDFDWLPNNKLVYASEQTIYLTDIESTQGSPIITFPLEDGEPRQLAVSPDGTMLAFTLVTSANPSAIHGTTWVLDLVSGQLRQLTDTPAPNDPGSVIDDPKINFPTWSPDGRWILVVESSSRVAIAYIVPSDGEKVLVTEDEATTARPVLSFYMETLGIADRPLSNKFDIDVGNLIWLP